MPTNRFSALSTAALFACCLTACDRDKETTAIPDSGQKTLTVSVIALEAEPWTYTLVTYGQLRSSDTVNIGADSAGTVIRVWVREGNTVTRGQKLVELDREKEQLRLRRAIANRESIAADLDQAARQLQKYEQVISAGTVSKEMLEQARTRRDALAARVSQADSEIEIARRELDERTVTSPLDGIVEGEPVDVGERVNPGQTLLTIQSNDALQVTTWVNQEEVNQIQRGQRAEVTVSASDRSVMAVVESVSRSASSSTGNFEVKLRLSDAGGSLREGMSARVKLPLRNNREVIFVPRDAVVDRNRQRVVYVVEDGVARPRVPTFGLPDGDRIPALSGLSSGDLLIVAPLAYVNDGGIVALASSDR